MQVASVKTKESDNKNLILGLNQSTEYKINQYLQISGKNLPKDIFNKKISFGASIEYYAQKYLHAENFEQRLIDEIWKDDFNAWQRFWGTNKNIAKLKEKALAVMCKIQELKEEIAEKYQKADELKKKLKYQERQVAREQEKQEAMIRQQQAALEKKRKLEKIALEKEKIKVEKQKLEIEADNLKFDKERVQEQKFSDFAKVLQTKFIDLIKIEKNGNKVTVPNGIMLSGLDKDDSNELIEWIVKKADCNLEKIDFANLTNNEVLSSLDKIAQKAEKSDKRTLIYIENFDKFTTPKEENNIIIPKLKAFLTSCSEKYKCTVITNVKDPSKLVSEITAPQRFKVKINEDN